MQSHVLPYHADLVGFGEKCGINGDSRSDIDEEDGFNRLGDEHMSFPLLSSLLFMRLKLLSFLSALASLILSSKIILPLLSLLSKLSIITV